MGDVLIQSVDAQRITDEIVDYANDTRKRQTTLRAMVDGAISEGAHVALGFDVVGYMYHIADRAGYSEDWARRLTADVRSAAKVERNEKIKRLADDGKTQREIADEIGVGVGTVNRVFQNGNTPILEHGNGAPVAERPLPEWADDRTGGPKFLTGEYDTVSNMTGTFWIDRSSGTKECKACNQLWAADIEFCPYCNQTPELRAHMANESRQNDVLIKQAEPLPLTAANHAVSSDPNYDGDEWYTPSAYIEAARMAMGDIDFDPASSHEAQENIRAGRYCTKDDDSLSPSAEWSGRVWMNPPYSTPLIQKFIDRIIDEYDAGNVSEAVVLTNNSSDTKWFHKMLARFPACFTRGRVQFWRGDHETFGARQGQAVFYIGRNFDKFAMAFDDLGIIVEAK